MALRILTFPLATSILRSIGVNDTAVNRSLKRLSTGLRINYASDDPGGLSVAESLRAQINGLNQATTNSQGARDLLSTAEGALGEASTLLQRMRDLAVQAANDTLTASDRVNIKTELDALSAEIDNIARNTSFNTKTLLNGGNSALTGFTFQVGSNAGQVLNFKISTSDAGAVGVLTTQISVDTVANASVTIATIDAAIGKITSFRSSLGASINRLDAVVSTLAVQAQNLTASESRIRDLDVAAETALLTRNQVLRSSSLAMLSQANGTFASVLDLLRQR